MTTAIICHTVTVCGEYGSKTSIKIISAPSRGALRRAVRELNIGHIPTSCGYDCTGRLCGQSAMLLKSYRDDAGYVGVVEVNQTWDV